MTKGSDGFYIGLMSGTSLDGVDAALVRFGQQKIVTATHFLPFTPSDKAQLKQLMRSSFSPEQWISTGRLIAERYAQAATPLIAKAGGPQAVCALGAHGQTVFHRPKQGAQAAITLQCIDAFWLAEMTDIDVVFDFRQADVAAGGHGAPLVPPFHAEWFGCPNLKQAIVNIGGIANVTLLDGYTVTAGYDIGPGNTLLDQWCQKHLDKSYDTNGQWAGSGQLHDDWLAQLLSDPYFSLPAPKSTGPEYFNLAWLEQRLPKLETCPPEDVQATLLALTATSIAQACKKVERVVLCGGGAKNTTLVHEICARCQAPVIDSQTLGLNPDYVEAAAFAWLAYQYMSDRPANLPKVTGACTPRILGTRIKRV